MRKAGSLRIKGTFFDDHMAFSLYDVHGVKGLNEPIASTRVEDEHSPRAQKLSYRDEEILAILYAMVAPAREEEAKTLSKPPCGKL